MARLYCTETLAAGRFLELPEGPARHVQVLRLQPGAALTLFDGKGGEYDAQVAHMGRGRVQVTVGAHHAIEREAPREVHIAVGMPANERMDWLVEKATELGVASIQPLVAQRSVVKLVGERAQKRQAHWQGIAIAACEQCGRNRVPAVHEPLGLSQWLAGVTTPALRQVLSLSPAAKPLDATSDSGPVLTLSGPEGGLTEEEEAAALAHGFLPVTLGPRTLRSETAPLVLLSALTLAR